MSPSQVALDTNAYRALGEGNPTLASLIRQAAAVALPCIVLGELYFGFYAGARPQENIQALKAFLAVPRVSILFIDEITPRFFGEIASELRRTGRPIQQDDMWIAALCKQHDYALATADKDFDAVTGLELCRF